MNGGLCQQFAQVLGSEILDYKNGMYIVMRLRDIMHGLAV